ncbi:MAG: SDR family NAD(P)-dependent oxidoreductase [Gammaproteobacteria bacterium]
MTTARYLIVGATSAIAEAFAARAAAAGGALYLAARNVERLVALEKDLGFHGAAAVLTAVLDVSDRHALAQLPARAAAHLGGLDIIFLAHGVLPAQERCESDPEVLAALVETNTLSTWILAAAGARELAARGGGTLVILSSVAGDRGRRGNYAYGASKAALDCFAEGLFHRYWRDGVNVLTVKPGFVDTPMTADMAKGLLWAQPDTIARDITHAIDARRRVLYSPWFWRPIMSVVRALPTALFKRMSF